MSDLFPPTSDLAKNATTYLKDLLERVLTAALGGFLGGVVITQPLDGSMWYAAGAAGVGAAVSLLKGLAARLRGDRNSASLSRSV